jgi:hypothetical protein
MGRWRFLQTRNNKDVTYRGYVASRPELPDISAFSLQMLRRRIEERLLGEDVDVRLAFDRKARFERDQRRRAGRGGAD